MGKQLYPRQYQPAGTFDMRPWEEILAEHNQQQEDAEKKIERLTLSTQAIAKRAGVPLSHLSDRLKVGEDVKEPFL